MKFITLFTILFCSQVVFSAEKSYQSILFIGDSHSYGPFGSVIDQTLREQSEKVVSISSCGASASTWLERANNFKSTNCGYWKKTDSQKEIRTLSHQLNSLKSELSSALPQITVISLGTNMLGDINDFENELKSVEKLILQVNESGSRCIWIGPPDLTKQPLTQNLNSFNEKLKNFVESKKCNYIDSSKLTSYQFTKSDGIHYPPKASKEWGEKISQEILLQLKPLPRIDSGSNSASPVQKNRKSAVQ